MLPQMLAGDKISALAITEPDAAAPTWRRSEHHGAARRRPLYRQRPEDLHHLRHAGRLHLPLRCARGGEGAGRRQLLLIEGDTPGLSRTPLKKMGWWASDTATLHFDEVPGAGRQPDRRRRTGASR